MRHFRLWFVYKTFIFILCCVGGLIITMITHDLPHILMTALIGGVAALFAGAGTRALAGKVQREISANDLKAIQQSIARFTPYLSIVSVFQAYLMYNLVKIFDIIIWDDVKIRDGAALAQIFEAKLFPLIIMFFVLCPLYLGLRNFFLFFSPEKIWNYFVNDMGLGAKLENEKACKCECHCENSSDRPRPT